MIFPILGFPSGLVQSRESRNRLLAKYLGGVATPVPVEREWVPKNPEIPILDRYDVDPPVSYWSNWPTNRDLQKQPRSWINLEGLLEVAKEAGYTNSVELDWAANIIQNGAKLGVSGAGRIGFDSKNYPSASLHGKLLGDALADWTKKGLVLGPFKSSELPFAEPRISPVSVVPKPSGHGRVVVDLSAPHLPNPDINGDEAISVNSGIDGSQFPCGGSNSRDILHKLYLFGRGCWLAKQDWSDAYKHIAVADDDLRLQVIRFMDRLFVELSLTFGSRSSPGIFDRLSDLILLLACIMASMSRSDIVKQLDDVVCVNTKEMVEKFYATYQDVCQRVGVRLADPVDPDKCFAGCQQGTILGIDYDTSEWTWSFSKKKVNSLLELLNMVVKEGRVQTKSLMKLSGKLEFYKDTVSKRGRWERGFILHAIANSPNHNAMVECDGPTISQCHWWIRNIMASTVHSPIPDPHTWRELHCLNYYPDASGGANLSVGGGIGGVMQYNKEALYLYMQHSNLIKSNSKNYLNERLGSKLTFLEAVGALAGPCAMPEQVRGRTVVIHVDNAGTVFCHKRAYSRCPYAYSILLALEVVSTSLNCRVFLKKTPRCSGRYQTIADLLSKGKFPEAWDLMGRNVLMEVPRTLLKYMQWPTRTRTLGNSIIQEMQRSTMVLEPEPEFKSEVNHLVWKRSYGE